MKDKAEAEDDTEEFSQKKKKKPLEEDKNTDDEETPKKKKKPLDEDEETTLTNNNADEDENNDYNTRKTKYSKGWTSAEKDAFMNTCVTSASTGLGQRKAENYCSCMLQKLQREYPNANDAGRMTTEESTELARACLGN